MPGKNLLTDDVGAWIDASADEGDVEKAITVWRAAAQVMLHEVGWTEARTFARAFAGGFSVMLTAPFDALYAATEINEWAFLRAQKALGTPTEPKLHHLDLPTDAAAELLRARIEKESKPRLVALRSTAERHGIAFVWDDRAVSLGHGQGSLTFASDALPEPDDVPWQALANVRIALVTGTNGKTTTVRLLAQICKEAGLVPGVSSTDWVKVGDEVLDRGDYSGPMAARMVLRDRRTQIAILETARGGILRRGLGVPRADAAVITNIAEDHLGEFGIGDLRGLVDAKFTVARAIDTHGRLVLNADDAPVHERGRETPKPLLWIALDPEHPTLQRHLEAGGDACFVDDDSLVLVRKKQTHALVPVREVPITLDGAALYNISNALGAAGAAAAMGLSPRAIAAGLRSFDNTPETNPGRANVFSVRGATVFADFAHNPHGLQALFEMARRMQPKRMLVVLGQAGDRTDDAIKDMVRVTWQARPDRILIKEMTKYLRGRPAGEVASLIESELLRLGAPRDALVRCASEMDAVERALAWTEPGDLVLLLLHAERDAALEMLRERAAGA